MARISRDVGGVLDHPEAYPDGSDLVDDAAWWRVPGGPMSVLDYAKAHLPARFKLDAESFGAIPAADRPRDSGPSRLPPNTYQLAGYHFGVQGGLAPLEWATMLVDAARSASGQAYVRVDAQLA
jgi:hypothetical protein